MYACIPDIGGGFLEVVRPPSSATADLHDPPPPPSAKETEPRHWGSGPQGITRRATVRGALAWGRGKPPPAHCPSTARKIPTHHAACHRHAPQSIACRGAPRRSP